MASSKPRRLQATSVDIRFPLARFHSSLAGVWNLSVESPGTPQGGDHVPTGLGTSSAEYLFSQILSKFDDGRKNLNKEATTWERFHEAEDLCRDTNHRLSSKGAFGEFQGTFELARDIASKILGPARLDQVAEGMGWGPGASTRLPRRMSDAAYKYSGLPESTAGNAALAIAAIRSVPSWEQEVRLHAPNPPHLWDYLKVVKGNRIVTVPKNYKTDRTIAIEPDMNMYVQKGIGALMRKRLRLFGCDLNDQTRNQRLAQVGSIAGRLATIDMSMASDTVSRQLVSMFIRPDWLELLEQSRSPFGVLPSGETIFYQKFSSMGNGYTFELESLIFYSLALAHCHLHDVEASRVSVFGDDVILPSAVATSFMRLLEVCGFKANLSKSFWTGNFRESCGKHYFLGHEVTPFYVRRNIAKLTDLFLLHNNLLRFARRSDWLSASELERVSGILNWIRSYAPARWRKPRIFDGYGDGAFIGSFDEVCPTPAPFGLEAWECKVLAEVPSRDVHLDIPGLMASGLKKAGSSHTGDVLLVREPVAVYPVKSRRYKEIKILIPQYALGRYLRG